MKDIYTEGFDASLVRQLLLNMNLREGEDFKITKISGNIHTLFKLEPALLDSCLKGNQLVFIVDADSERIGNGGAKIARDLLDDFNNKVEFDFKYFILPDDSSNGTFEDLLEKIIHPNHFPILSCFDEYVICLGKNGYTKPTYNVPNKKVRIYAYTSTLGRDQKDGNYGFEDEELWNLKAKGIIPINKFLGSLFE